jgi:probable blue pigment (indigoidine) exporter
MLWITAAWGGCFVTIRWGLRDAPVLWFATLRALVAGVALVGIATVQGRARPAGARAWWLIGVLAVTNASVAFAAMFAGVDGLATGTAAVLANAQPLLILLPAWWLYGERVTARTSVGMVVGFAGLLVVAVPGGGGSGAWLSILAATAITVGTLLSRRLAGIDLVQAAGWHFLIGGAVLAAVAGGVEGLPRIDWTPRFVLALAFLALIGTALAFWAWFTETMRCPLGELAAWTFLTPVFGIALGLVLTGERPGGWTAAGMVLVLASLWTVVRAPHAAAT